jgi:hypothetical protein
MSDDITQTYTSDEAGLREAARNYAPTSGALDPPPEREHRLDGYKPLFPKRDHDEPADASVRNIAREREQARNERSFGDIIRDADANVAKGHRSEIAGARFRKFYGVFALGSWFCSAACREKRRTDELDARKEERRLPFPVVSSRNYRNG